MYKKIKHNLAYYYASLFSRVSFAKYHYFLLNLSLRGLGIMNYYDNIISGEFHFINSVLPNLIDNKNPIIFDVGANKGDYSKLLTSKFQNANIYAFEPHPNNYKILSSFKSPNFFPIQCALGSIEGEAILFDRLDSDGSTHATLYENVIREIHHQEVGSFKVRVDTIDKISTEFNIHYIDLLKIDTEGNEFSVLQGGKKMVAQSNIGVIQFEFNEMNIYSRTFFKDFQSLLDVNYEFFRLLPHSLLPLPKSALLTEIFGFQNIVAISKSILPHK